MDQIDIKRIGGFFKKLLPGAVIIYIVPVLLALFTDKWFAHILSAKRMFVPLLMLFAVVIFSSKKPSRNTLKLLIGSFAFFSLHMVDVSWVVNSLFLPKLIFIAFWIDFLFFDREDTIFERNSKRLRDVVDQIELSNRFVLLIVLSVFLFRLILNQMYIGADEGSYAYDAYLLSQGYTPYIDFPTRALPQIAVYSVAGSLLGNFVMGLHIVNAIFSALQVLVFSRLLSVLKVSKQNHLLFLALYVVSPIIIFNHTVASTLVFESLLLLSGVYFLTINLKKITDGSSSFIHYLVPVGLITIATLIRATSGALLLIWAALLTYDAWRNRSVNTLIKHSLLSFVAAIISMSPILMYLYPRGGMELIIKALLPGGVLAKEAVQPLFISFQLAQLGYILTAGLVGLILIVGIVRIRGKEFTTQSSLPIFLAFTLPGLIYFFYIFKRGFNLVYLTSIYPFMLIWVAIQYDYLKGSVGVWMKLLVTSVFGLTILATPIYLARSETIFEGVPIRSVVGSGFFREEDQHAKAFIEENLEVGSTVLAGSLNWVLYADSMQFHNISRPLIYEGEATIYKLFDFPDRDQLRDEFRESPPKYIFYDHHFELAFPFLEDELREMYRLVYNERTVQIYELK